MDDTVSSLPEAVGGPDIGVKGKNDFGGLGYGGAYPGAGAIGQVEEVDTLVERKG